PGRRLDTGGEVILGMTGGRAAPLTKPLDLLERQIVSGQVEQRVEQHRAMSSRQHEAVAIGPRRIRRAVPQEPRPQHIGHRGRAHGQARVTRVGLLHGIDGKKPDRVDRPLVEIPLCHIHPSGRDIVVTWPSSQTSTVCAIPTKSPVPTTPGIARSFSSSRAASAMACTAQSTIRLPLSLRTGAPPLVRTTGGYPSAASRRRQTPAANGTSSIGSLPRVPSAGTIFSRPTRMTSRRDAAATIFSRTRAPP